MSRRRLLLGAIVFWCVSAFACADILGIDDGKPRQYDASIDSPAETSPLDVKANDAPPPPMSPLVCGTSTCNAITQACCRTGNPSAADAQSFACIPSGDTCDGGLLVVCDEPKNCTAQGHPGDECCALVPEGGSIAYATACVKPGACAANALLCEPGDDEMCNFEAGQTCAASVATVIGWDLCK